MDSRRASPLKRMSEALGELGGCPRNCVEWKGFDLEGLARTDPTPSRGSRGYRPFCTAARTNVDFKKLDSFLRIMWIFTTLSHLCLEARQAVPPRVQEGTPTLVSQPALRSGEGAPGMRGLGGSRRGPGARTRRRFSPQKAGVQDTARGAPGRAQEAWLRRRCVNAEAPSHPRRSEHQALGRGRHASVVRARVTLASSEAGRAASPLCSSVRSRVQGLLGAPQPTAPFALPLRPAV